MNAQHESLVRSLISEGYLKTPRIIDAFRQIDRADFVLPEHRAEAYANYPLPIGEGQTISQPLTVAFMLELLDPRPGEKILDIGSGSGWTSALLTHCVSKKTTNHEPASPKLQRGELRTANSPLVFAIERMRTLCEFGKKNIRKYNFIKKGIAAAFCRDGSEGLAEQAPFDKILASAAASASVPESWRKQVRIGGVIVAPVGGSIWRFTKKTKTRWEEEEFPGFAFVPLVRNKEAGSKNDESGNGKAKEQKRGQILVSFPVALGGVLALAAILFVAEIYVPHVSYQGTKTIEVAPGMGSRAIANALKDRGIIRSKWMFIAYASLRSEASSLKPGVYTFTNQSIRQISRALVSGGERTLTIPEGWTIQDIAQALERNGIAEPDEFLTAAAGDSRALKNEFPFLAGIAHSRSLEGYLFPDTYRFFPKTPPEFAARTMLRTFEKKITPDLRDEIARRGRTLDEVITMASLIEKEVVSDEDRALVSGILWKRLEQGIPLQADATIAYVKKYERGLPTDASGKISLSDTKIDSPYNTYLFRGLPRGPIANPGISAIRAAVFPQDSPYLYYLSAPDGKTVFSKTLEEHNRAKVKYLQRSS